MDCNFVVTLDRTTNLTPYSIYSSSHSRYSLHVSIGGEIIIQIKINLVPPGSGSVVGSVSSVIVSLLLLLVLLLLTCCIETTSNNTTTNASSSSSSGSDCSRLNISLLLAVHASILARKSS